MVFRELLRAQRRRRVRSRIDHLHRECVDEVRGRLRQLTPLDPVCLLDQIGLGDRHLVLSIAREVDPRDLPGLYADQHAVGARRQPLVAPGRLPRLGQCRAVGPELVVVE